MFEIIFQQLDDLRGDTALLESCDWDEELATNAIHDLKKVMLTFGGGDINKFKSHILESLKDKFDDEIVYCLLDMIDSQFANVIDINKEIN